MPDQVNRNHFLVAFATLSSLMGISVGLAKVTTSLYAIALGATESELGWIAGSQSVGVLLMSLPLGVLVERHGPKRLFLIGTTSAGLLYAILPLVPTPMFLLTCTLCIGFFMPFRFVSLNTIFLRQLSEIGQHRAGWYRGSHVAGMYLLGPLMAATAIDRLGYAGTYWLICAIFAATILLSPILLARDDVHQHASQPGSFAALAGRLRAGLDDAEVRAACCTEAGAQVISIYYNFFIVAIAVSKLGFSKSEAAGLVAVQGLSYVFSLFALGGFMSRLGEVTGSLLSVGLLLLSLLVLGLTRDLRWLQAGGLVLGLGLGSLQIGNLMRFARIGARIGHGHTAGLNALAGPLGGLLGSGIGGGFLGRELGLQNVFLCFLPLALFLGVVSTPQLVLGSTRARASKR